MAEGYITDDVRRLMEMDTETVSAKDIAPILHMDPSVIIKYAKDGTWNCERNGDFVISGEGPGSHVKFKRVDFLRKWGFLEPEPPERTVAQAIDDLREELHDIGLVMLAQLSIGPLLRLEELKEKEKDRQRGNADGLRKGAQV